MEAANAYLQLSTFLQESPPYVDGIHHELWMQRFFIRILVLIVAKGLESSCGYTYVFGCLLSSYKISSSSSSNDTWPPLGDSTERIIRSYTGRSSDSKLSTKVRQAAITTVLVGCNYINFCITYGNRSDIFSSVALPSKCTVDFICNKRFLYIYLLSTERDHIA